MAAAVLLPLASSVNAATPPNGPIGFCLTLDSLEEIQSDKAHGAALYSRRHLYFDVEVCGGCQGQPTSPRNVVRYLQLANYFEPCTVAALKFCPVPVGSTNAFIGPAPSWFT